MDVIVLSELLHHDRLLPAGELQELVEPGSGADLQVISISMSIFEIILVLYVFHLGVPTEQES